MHRKVPAWFGPGAVGKGTATSGNLANGLPVLIAAVRDLNRLELAGETVRACLEALVVAAPGWLAEAIDVPGWGKRYTARVDSWRLPTSEPKRVELALAYGTDGYALLRAVYAPDTPAWLRELPAVEVLRVVLLGELHPHGHRERTGGDHTAGGGHRWSPARQMAREFAV